ncbi:cytochrome c oxidase subunit 8A, mitochondrial [Sigmodon hispidus]
MSFLTPPLLLLLLLLRGLTWSQAADGAQVHWKPPWEQLGVVDVTIALASCFTCCLLPAGWVLSHLDNYKKRE